MNVYCAYNTTAYSQTSTCIVDSRVGHPSDVACCVIAAVHRRGVVGVAPVHVVVAHFMGVQRGRNVALGRRLVLNTPTMVVTVMGLRLAVVSGPPCGGMMVWGYARIYNHGRSIGSSSLSCGRTRGHSARVGRYGMSFHAAYGCMRRGMPTGST